MIHPIIDQFDSDEEFPEPLMIEEVQGRNGYQNKLPRLSSFIGVGMQIEENTLKNRDKMDKYRKPVGKLEVMNQSAASTFLFEWKSLLTLGSGFLCPLIL